MSSEVYEDVVEIPIGLLEAGSLPLDRSTPSYPFPELQPKGQVEARTFPTVVLENPYLKVVIVPSLGGRVLSLYDKRTETELLPRAERLMPVPGGPRGLFLPVGIEWGLTGDPRLNSMGTVAVAAEPPEDESAAAVVWIAETSMQNGLGFHVRLSLPPDAARLDVRFRAQNRTFTPIPYAGGLIVHANGQLSGRTFQSPRGTLVVESNRWTVLDGLSATDSTLRIGRFADGFKLGARQSDTLEISLIPYGIPEQTNVADGVCVGFAPTLVSVLCDEDRPGQKLVLQTTTGQVLEAAVNLTAHTLLQIPLEDLPAPAVAVALLDGTGREVLRVPSHERESETPSISYTEPPEFPVSARSEDWSRLTQDPALRAAAWVQLAHVCIARSEWIDADFALEQSLLFNGDDALAWWAKAVVKRLQGSEEEPVESLNAHYLTPLEPVLRAEAFLSMPSSQGHEPSPVVRPIAEIPEDLIEVACRLIELGASESAGRWIDEALRHHDLAMLRYLLADLLLTGPKLDVEAAEQISAAAKALLPPLPWRPTEIAALRRLHARFPTDEPLTRLLRLAEQNLA